MKFTEDFFSLFLLNKWQHAHVCFLTQKYPTFKASQKILQRPNTEGMSHYTESQKEVLWASALPL